MNARGLIPSLPRMRFAYPGYAVLLLASTALTAQNFDIDWWTVDGGGEVLSETADQQWQLSGTLGQWDSTEALELAGGGWTLTGGFWPVTVEKTDRIFSDGFES
ncbi:MAG: hypothetical protein RQ729_12810 [Wenzhouxiangellaceae bacterium]|nr:hypothetical protein [Wenzhouxiangellaceae bacterium]